MSSSVTTTRLRRRRFGGVLIAHPVQPFLHGVTCPLLLAPALLPVGLCCQKTMNAIRQVCAGGAPANFSSRGAQHF
jgi:hypothetical protein